MNHFNSAIELGQWGNYLYDHRLSFNLQLIKIANTKSKKREREMNMYVLTNCTWSIF